LVRCEPAFLLPPRLFFSLLFLVSAASFSLRSFLVPGSLFPFCFTTSFKQSSRVIFSHQSAALFLVARLVVVFINGCCKRPSAFTASPRCRSCRSWFSLSDPCAFRLLSTPFFSFPFLPASFFFLLSIRWCLAFSRIIIATAAYLLVLSFTSFPFFPRKSRSFRLPLTVPLSCS